MLTILHLRLFLCFSEAVWRTRNLLLWYFTVTLRSFMLLLGHTVMEFANEALGFEFHCTASLVGSYESGVLMTEPWLGWWRYLFCLVRSSRSLDGNIATLFGGRAIGPAKVAVIGSSFCLAW